MTAGGAPSARFTAAASMSRKAATTSAARTRSRPRPAAVCGPVSSAPLVVREAAAGRRDSGASDASGGGWRFRADGRGGQPGGERLSRRPRATPSEQIVLTGYPGRAAAGEMGNHEGGLMLTQDMLARAEALLAKAGRRILGLVGAPGGASQVSPPASPRGSGALPVVRADGRISPGQRGTGTIGQSPDERARRTPSTPRAMPPCCIAFAIRAGRDGLRARVPPRNRRADRGSIPVGNDSGWSSPKATTAARRRIPGRAGAARRGMVPGGGRGTAGGMAAGPARQLRPEPEEARAGSQRPTSRTQCLDPGVARSGGLDSGCGLGRRMTARKRLRGTGRNPVAARRHGRVEILEIINVDFSLHHFLLPLMRGMRARGHDVVGACADGPLLEPGPRGGLPYREPAAHAQLLARRTIRRFGPS